MTLTMSKINSMKAGDVLNDTEPKGLVIRANGDGSKTFILRTRLGSGREAAAIKPTIGRLGEVSLSEAREIAIDWKRRAKQGIDPARQEQRSAAEKAAADRRGDGTIAAVLPVFLEDRAAKRSAKRIEQRLNQWLLPKLGGHAIRDVTKDVVRKWYASIIADVRAASGDANEFTGAAAANRVFADFRALWNFAKNELDALPGDARNPFLGHDLATAADRSRPATLGEARRLLAALPTYIEQQESRAEAWQAVEIISLLITTGARKGEWFKARWEDIDLDRGIWTKPASTTKQKRVHHRTLSSRDIQILRQTLAREVEAGRGRRGDYVFPGRDGGAKSDIKRSWASIKELSGIDNLRMHDLRHTAAALLIETGADLFAVGKALGHSQQRTTERYASIFEAKQLEQSDAVAALLGAQKG